MIPKREVIDVRVHEKILWIGSKAYAVPHIVMAELSPWRLRRTPALQAYAKSLLLYVVVLVAATTLGSSILIRSETLPKLALFVVAIFFVARTIRLLEILSSGTYHVLVIRTAAASIEALISSDQRQLTKVADEIVQAINNPQANFTYQIEKLVSNTFNQKGLLNIGTQEIN